MFVFPRYLHTLIIASFALLVAGAPPLAADEVTEPSSTAMQFVERFGDRQLRSLLTQFAMRTQTIRMIVQRTGDNGLKIMSEEIGKAVDRHGPEWKTNLALSWQKKATDQELQSLAHDKQPPEELRKKMFALERMVGSEMKQRSYHILKAALTEVVMNTFERGIPEDEKDQPLRILE